MHVVVGIPSEIGAMQEFDGEETFSFQARHPALGDGKFGDWLNIDEEDRAEIVALAAAGKPVLFVVREEGKKKKNGDPWIQRTVKRIVKAGA